MEPLLHLLNRAQNKVCHQSKGFLFLILCSEKISLYFIKTFF